MPQTQHEPSLARDLTTLADLYATLFWNIGRRLASPQVFERPRADERRRRVLARGRDADEEAA